MDLLFTIDKKNFRMKEKALIGIMLVSGLNFNKAQWVDLYAVLSNSKSHFLVGLYSISRTLRIYEKPCPLERLSSLRISLFISTYWIRAFGFDSINRINTRE